MTHRRWPEVSGWVQLHSHVARPATARVAATDEENPFVIRHRELGCGRVGQALDLFFAFPEAEGLVGSVPCVDTRGLAVEGEGGGVGVPEGVGEAAHYLHRTALPGWRRRQPGETVPYEEGGQQQEPEDLHPSRRGDTGLGGRGASCQGSTSARGD